MNSTNLNELKCTPCTGKTKKLSNAEIEANLKKLDNWSINNENKMIFKKYSFKNFNESLNFANLVGKVSNEEGHHPDVSIGYSYCLIMLHTHAIKDLSINDFILAHKIDKIEI
tara:strand:+ start:2721 stop:3059 length:339 start_codon:yes stop_codon:yes gene_type:complete